MTEKLQLRRALSYLFILAIAIVFTISFGPGSSGFQGKTKAQKPTNAATVNGKDIPYKDFQTEFSNQLTYIKMQQRSFNEQLARQMGIDRQVLERLVYGELLAQEAEKRGISTPDSEVRDLLHKNSDFQKDGQFDVERYRQVIRDYYRKTDVEYEEDLRRRIAGNKLLTIVENAAVVSDDEVKARFFREGNKAEATFVRFIPSMFAEKVGAPKGEELAQWQTAHAAEVDSYYQENQFLYAQPEKLQARQILIRTAPGATDAQKAEAKQKAENLRKEIEGGKDFAEVAKQFSEDANTKTKGGSLGEVERMALDPAIAEPAFKLAAGQMTEVVETRAGAAFLKVEGKIAPKQKTLDEVRPEIAKQLWTKEKAKAVAKAEADKALAALRSGKKLATLFPPSKAGQPAAMRFETESKPEAIETGSFDASRESLPVLGVAPELTKDVFALEAAHSLDKVYSAGEGYAVVDVTQRSKPTDTLFTSQKDTLHEEAMKAKRIELRESFLKALKKQGNVVMNEELLRGDAVQS
ncbi:MAG: peptidylprolyl isomerase [Myxococcaceae bacterium]